MTLNYQILLTPLVSPSKYGDTVDITKDLDISDFIINGGIGSINRELDQGDYEIGVFNYGSIALNINNFDGKLNARGEDSRSIFPWRRDRAKVDISFFDSDGNSSISFRGLLSDKATRHNISRQTVRFVFLSSDSILQQDIVGPGSILDGMTFSESIRAVLDVPFVTSVLNYNGSDINPTLDLTVDNGSTFNSLLRKIAVDQLLKASNSVMIIDGDNNIIVRSRSVNSNTPHELFLNDQFKRDNIDAIPSYNNGLQRMFNSVVVNGEAQEDSISISEYAARQVTFALGFMTDFTKNQTIADSILSEFGIPRPEIDLVVETELAKDFNFLDQASIDVNYQLRKNNGYDVGIYDIDEYNKSKYPAEVGSFRINPIKKWKIIAFFEDPKTYKTKIRLRDTGEIII